MSKPVYSVTLYPISLLHCCVIFMEILLQGDAPSKIQMPVRRTGFRLVTMNPIHVRDDRITQLLYALFIYLLSLRSQQRNQEGIK